MYLYCNFIENSSDPPSVTSEGTDQAQSHFKAYNNCVPGQMQLFRFNSPNEAQNYTQLEPFNQVNFRGREHWRTVLSD